MKSKTEWRERKLSKRRKGTPDALIVFAGNLGMQADTRIHLSDTGKVATPNIVEAALAKEELSRGAEVD